MLFVIFSCILSLSNAIVLQKDLPEDAHLNFTQLAMEYGQPCEEFDVVTEDEYILKVFHLIGNECKEPVLLLHGVLDSADTFILRGNDSTAINLARAGHDVWLGNVRGNKYSNRNSHIDPVKDKNKFWNFTFHEMAIYDVPAIIDLVLEKTGKVKLSVIGHSQGNTVMYILGSMKPEYNEKISLCIALAPIAYLQEVSPVLSGVIKLYPAINAFFLGLGYEGVLQDKSAANRLIQFICTQGPLGYALCEQGVTASIAGPDSEELEPEFFDILIEHFPVGTSRKDFSHFVQIANSGVFAQFDYGLAKNMLVYNCSSPPAYDLSKVTMPFILLAGRNDGLAGLEDVKRLKNALPNVLVYHIMERKKFNHADFVWGKHINVYLNPLLKELLRKYA